VTTFAFIGDLRNNCGSIIGRLAEFTVFVCSLFNDPFPSNFDYIASTEKMIGE
jgi:hypothetical protein